MKRLMIAVTFLLLLLLGVAVSREVAHVMLRKRDNERFSASLDHMIKADSLAKAGQSAAAIREWHEALRLDPTFNAIHYHLARAYRRQGQITQAKAEYQTVIAGVAHEADKGGAAWAHYELGDVLKEEHQPEAAAVEWRAAIACVPTSVQQQAGLYLVRAKAQKALAEVLDGYTTPHTAP